jgi:hypothetical protein
MRGMPTLHPYFYPRSPTLLFCHRPPSIHSNS